MSDIVELLKMAARNGNALAGEAAAEIERLRADNAQLRAALREIDENLNVIQPQTQGSVLYQIRNVARRALEGEMKRYAAVDEAAKLAREQTATLREALTMNRHDIVERLRGYAEAKDD